MYSELFRSRTGDVFSVMLAITDIRTRAAAFADRWKDEASEDAEAKSFWDEFLAVFGVNRKRVAVFEKQVAKAGAKA